MDEEENKIIIDSKLNNSIRSYKEFDNILYTIGIDNLILGLIKIRSVSSEKEEGNQSIDESYLKNVKDIIPLGSYINGCIAIYNENTFEDFESVLNEEIEKIKEVNKNLLLNKSENEINYIQLALKELLYLDDEDDFNFEYKKYGEKTDDDFEIIFTDNLIKKYFIGNDAKYKFLVSNIQILFSNQKLENCENILELKKEQLNDEGCLNNIFNKDIFVKTKEQNLIITEDNFKEIKIDKYNDSNINIKNLYYANVLLGFKNNDKEKFIEYIKITDLELKENLLTNLYMEIIGIITLENKTNNNKKLIELMFSQLKNNISNIFSKDNTSINQKILLYNHLYNSLPFNLNASIPIEFQENQLISFKNNKSKIGISDEIKLSKAFNISGLPFYNFFPIIITSEETQDKIAIKLSDHILNPHLSLPGITEQSKDTHIIRGLVRGDYYYFHYNQDNFIDSGWGCAYRSLQTLISWFILNTSVGKNIKVPSIPEIQKILVKLGDKDKKIVGSNEWIGAIEVNLVLNDLLGIENQILFVNSGSEINSKGRELLYHFQHNGTPVMVGGGVYAYTILGVDYDKVKGECKFLILDPHYVGGDDIKTIINKGWCNWKSVDIFKKENFYNLCLPLAN